MRDLSVPIATETSARTNHSRRRRRPKTQTRQHCSREGTRERESVLFWPSRLHLLSWSLFFSPLSRCLVLLFSTTLPKDRRHRTLRRARHCCVSRRRQTDKSSTPPRNLDLIERSLLSSHFPPSPLRLLPPLSQSARGLPSFSHLSRSALIPPLPPRSRFQDPGPSQRLLAQLMTLL